MFERLLIQNFQAHSKLRVTFSKTVTCIVGPSDVGKSAIIRALRWVCHNMPTGDAFIQHGTKGASVQLIVDGRKLARRRSANGTTNTYSLDNQTFKAFGRDVPEPVAQLVNMSDLCWQDQHAGPYWFSETAGEISRQLNAIVNLDIIDRTIANTTKAVHRARTRLEVAGEELTTAKKEYDALAYVEGMDEALKVVEATYEQWQTAAIATAVLRAAVAEGIKCRDRTTNATAAATAADSVVTAGRRAVRVQKQHHILKGLVTTTTTLSEKVGGGVPDCTALVAAHAAYAKSVKASMTMFNLLDNIQKKERCVQQCNEKLAEAEKRVPNTCPTCGRYL